MIVKLSPQSPFARDIPSKYEAASARELVEPLDDPECPFESDDGRSSLRAQDLRNQILECGGESFAMFGPLAVARMAHGAHPPRLLDNHEVLVGIANDDVVVVAR